MNGLPKLTRRSFLRGAAIAGVAPLILPSSAWAAATGPNSQITVGVIGLGKQGRYLMDHCLKTDALRVAAVCDVDTTRRDWGRRTVEEFYAGRKVRGTYKGCEAFQDFRELVMHKGIDAVIIATPDHWHALPSIAAAHEGKDIYCEKPLSHTVLEGRAMVKAARRNKNIFQVGSMQRSMSEFRHACELVRNGVLGDVWAVDVGTGPIPPPRPCDLPAEPEEPGLDWNFWLGDAPMRPYNPILSPRGVYDKFPNWRYYQEYGTGGVGDWGAHHFDIVQWALGTDSSGPVEFIPPGNPNAKFGVRYRYHTGVEVFHQGVDGSPQGINGITFVCSNGKLYVNRGEFKLWIGGKLITDDVKESGQVAMDYLPPNAVRLYNSNNHLLDWITCMQTRRLPICDVEIGHRTATICELVNVTYRYHQRLQWDPVAERFAGGAGNHKWLSKEYRKPWHVS